MDAAGSVWVTLDQLTRLEYFATNTQIVPKRTVRSLMSGRHPSAMRGRGLDFEEVRKYVMGDDIRNIDWRVTARTKTTHTKVFNEERERPVFIVLDMSSSMFIGTSQYTKSVIAAQLAAVLGFSILNRGDRFGGLVFNDEDEQMVRPVRHRPALQRFLRATADYSKKLIERETVQPSSERLMSILKRIPSLITHDYIIHVMSDFTHFSEEDYQVFWPIKRKNDLVLTHIEDPFDKHLPAQKIVVTDGSMQVEVNSSNQNLDSWESSYDKFDRLFKDQYSKYQTPTMVFTTATSVEDQIKSTIGKFLGR